MLSHILFSNFPCDQQSKTSSIENIQMTVPPSSSKYSQSTAELPDPFEVQVDFVVWEPLGRWRCGH